jgi:hypothetical protein
MCLAKVLPRIHLTQMLMKLELAEEDGDVKELDIEWDGANLADLVCLVWHEFRGELIDIVAMDTVATLNRLEYLPKTPANFRFMFKVMAGFLEALMNDQDDEVPEWAKGIGF